jgi:hypothetical protein
MEFVACPGDRPDVNSAEEFLESFGGFLTTSLVTDKFSEVIAD